MNYPLIYLYNSIEKIHNIFSILLDIIKNDTVVRFDTLNESLKIFCENENENMIMQRYHLLKGQEINAKSKDFFLSCLLTDIFNILNFFINNNSFIFTIFNFIEFKNILYGEFYIVSEINLDYDKVKRDNNNKTAIYLYDVDNNEINKFITIYCKNKILIILSKIWCLNNNLNSFKIIIHTYKEIYESKYLDIRKNIYD
ncbi:hypothetical protein NAPIS_ORF00625 [Vairimorpha apis BRL 01]|uniref:Uncharacterized protein n=1 Tax=Vairimorpha apis BRL 01 TaxID=1037528 RepID=T0L2M5_9MICR|nr:hypothetical protein NAPIS_ORF00625 [Vairimorpha apis BRL 01]